MFLDNTEFPYMIITYEGETFLLVAKRNIRRLSFDMNFLAVGLVTNIEGSDKTLTYRLDKLMKETPSSVKETWFRRGYFAVNRSGIYIKFSKKHKNSIMKFFKSIPFFTSFEINS